MPDSVNLADEFAPPETVKSATSLADEFDPPDRTDQHAVINDAAEKARLFKAAFDPSLPQEKRQASAQIVLAQMAGSFLPHAGKEGVDTIKVYWDEAVQPRRGFGETKGHAATLPAAPETKSDTPITFYGTTVPTAPAPILAGAYNGFMPVATGFSSPLNIGTLGTFGALTKLAQGTGPIATAAKAGLTAIKTYFTAEMAKGAGEAAGKASVELPSPDVSTQQKTTDVVETLVQSAFAALAGKSATEIEPSVKRGATNPDAVKEALTKQESQNANPQPSPTTQVPVGPEAETSGGQVAEGVAREPVQPAGAGAAEVAQAPKVDYQYTVQRPQEVDGRTIPGYVQVDELVDGKNTRSTTVEALKKEGVVIPDVPEHLPQGQYTLEQIKAAQPKLAEEFVPPPAGSEEHAAITEELGKQPEAAPQWVRGESQRNANGDLFFSASPEIAGDFGKTRPIAESERPKNPLVVEDKTALAEKIGYKGDPMAESLDTPPEQRFDTLAKEYAKKNGYDGIQYDNGTLGEPELHAFKPELAREVTHPPEGPTGIRNAIVDEERKTRGLPPAMEEAKRGFGEVWTDAMKRLNDDPEAARKLTDELVDKPRAITDTEDALLTHRQVDLQNQFDKLTDRIVNGAEGQTPESLAADKIQLAKLSDDLLDVYEADKGAGRETARGLNARKMLVNEDYSLARMVTTRRAANEGRPLTPEQTAEVEALHKKIAETQKAFDDYRAKAEAAQKAQAGQKAIRKVVVTYIGERANEARARIKARMAEGRQMSGIDPTELADYAIIGAEHLVRAADTGIDWAESMVKELGEKIRPHLEEIRSAAQKELDDANKARAEETRLKAFKTRTANRIEDLNQRVAEGDLGPREPLPPLKLDPEAMRLRAEAIRAQQEFQTAVIKDRLNNRSWAEKAQDTLIRWRRGFLLSGPITLAKLTGAAVLRAATTPIEEVAGAAIGKALPDIFNKAPRHGGFSSRAEAEAITSVWTKGIADARQKLTTAKSDLDVLFGKGASGKVRESDVIPQSLIDFFGNLHGALKAPIMRSEFERSMIKRMDHAIREGVDVSDPLVQTKIAMDAYKDSQRAIFMQDNVLSKAFNTMVASLENSKVNDGRSAVGKGVATTLRLILPIVKVPTNIVAEAAEYAVGSITGSVEAAKALKDGIKDLTPEQADKIARQLKKGSLGAAALLIGYYNRDKLGGLYQQGEKRKKDDLKPGEVQAGPVKVGRAFTHSSLMEVMQIGATVGRITDEKVKGKNTPIHEAIGEATLGLLEELPFVRTPIELGKLFDKRERPYTDGELVKGLVVPQAVSQVATYLDTDAKGNPISRKPSTVLEHVKTGIPGLRETVRKR